jgi:hypothetical protein
LLTSAAYSSSVALETCVCTGVAVAGVAARAKAASTAAAESQKVFGRCLVVLIIRLVFMAILDWCSLTADRFGSWDGLRREAGGSSIGGARAGRGPGKTLLALAFRYAKELPSVYGFFGRK